MRRPLFPRLLPWLPWLFWAALPFCVEGADGVAASPALKVELRPVGAVNGLFALAQSLESFVPSGRTVPIEVAVSDPSASVRARKGVIRIAVTDAGGSAVPAPDRLGFSLSAGGSPAVQTLRLAARPGFYRIAAWIDGTPGSAAEAEIGVVPPPRDGPRPDSFFATNYPLRDGTDLPFLAALGLKVVRTHFQPDVQLPQGDPFWKQPSEGKPLPLDFGRLDALWGDLRAHGLWVLPVAAYGFDPAYGKTEQARRLGSHGPPRNAREFTATWEEIVRHYPEIGVYEFWNEPWIFGWTWGDTPAAYRALQEAWCRMARAAHAGVRIVAGSSASFAREHIAPHPESWQGLLSGLSHHPYSRSVGEPDFRGGDNLRSIDAGGLLTRELGLPFYYLTEGGTLYAPPSLPVRAAEEQTQQALLLRQREIIAARETGTDAYRVLASDMEASRLRLRALPDPRDNPENARKLVQYYVNAALAGAFMGNSQWDIGYGPTWMRSDVALATMTSFLEDRPVVADVWPAQSLLTGAVFAHPRWIDAEARALPRANELSARWAVPVPPERNEDDEKVAVMWALTGPGPGSSPASEGLDDGGTLSFGAPGDLRAWDLDGREIAPRNGRLVVPLGPSPVYVATRELSVARFRERLAGAEISGVTPFNASALSLQEPADRPQALRVRIVNQVNRPLSCRLALRIGDREIASTVVQTRAGALEEATLAWPGFPLSERNAYPVTLTAEAPEKGWKKFSVWQEIAAARFAHRTITVDGSLDDWKGVVPVTIDSARLAGGSDATSALLNPGQAVAAGKASAPPHVAVRVYAAYDDRNVYLASLVDEPELHCVAGTPVSKGRLAEKVTLPYAAGTPGGLDHITLCGDVFQFAFGFRDRVPGIGRQMDDPWAWKGMFYDTDYCYAAHASSDGDRLVRLWGADTSRRDGYQTEPVPGIETVPGARIRIRRLEERKQTVYEMAIPRAELALFRPEAGTLRFGFRLYNDEKQGDRDDDGALSWSDAAGVFDFWRNSGSFPPTWASCLPCQTFFGVER